MAIIQNRFGTPSQPSTVTTLWEGRVIRIEKVRETRNWSDTMDYSDYRTTDCLYALVWLGTHNVPPRMIGGRPHTDLEPTRYAFQERQARDLEFFEQFAWIDCTNIHSHNFGYSLAPRVDGEVCLFGEGLMWVNLVAWESYHEALRRKEAHEAAQKEVERLAEEEKRRLAAERRSVQKEERLNASRIAGEALLDRIPPKGTSVTVGGVTGVVFWKGMSRYRGRFFARAGVRDASGAVHWIDAGAFPV